MEKAFRERASVFVDLYSISAVLNSSENAKFMTIYVSWTCTLEDAMISSAEFCVFTQLCLQEWKPKS